MLVGRVGFDEQPVGGNVTEGFPLAFLAGVGEMAGKGKISAQFGQRFDQFTRAAIAVQEKTAGGQGTGLQQFRQPAPGLQAVNGHRQIAPGRQAQLGRKHLLLTVIRQIRFPTIQPDLADGGRNRVQ